MQNDRSIYELEKVYRVYDNTAGACIEVRPDPDGCNSVQVHTPDKQSQDYYGKLELNLDAEQGPLLIDAIGQALTDLKGA